MRAGAWLISPFTGWKWAKWPTGEVGWIPADAELPPKMRVSADNRLVIDVPSQRVVAFVGHSPLERSKACWGKAAKFGKPVVINVIIAHQ